ncbi:MAG TPA: LamG-like jellyroll fold domain-containing protein, partial [Planctomycetota bacterium]|nr:LamG-like jellyroll fold domain-containing protein [Planctomycetota bacterium]
LEEDTAIARFYEDDGARLELKQGVLRATVAKQPAGRTFAIVTPHGEARVIGTAFLITVGPDATRLAVEEGKVRLNGLDVSAGHLAVATPTAPAAVRPITSLLAHWKLDEGRGRVAFDASGLGNDAVLKDQADWAPGRSGGGVECAKGGIYVPRFHAPGPAPGDGFTVAMWVYHEKLDAWQDVYFSMPGLAFVREGNLEIGRVRVAVRTDPPVVFGMDAVVRPRQWMHLALVWDGALARFYRNGRLVGSAKAKGTVLPPRSMTVNAGQEVEGRIDDVRLYRRALAPQEITQVMSGGEVR